MKAPPILKDLSDDSIDIDYKEYVDDPIDFKKSKYIMFIPLVLLFNCNTFLFLFQVENKFQDEKYSSMTDAIKDIRLVFLNCYKFYGTRSDHTLKSLKLEKLFERKIGDLDE